MFATRSSTALRAVARRNFTSSAPSRAATQEKASSALNDITKKAQELGGPVVKRVEGLLGGRYPTNSTGKKLSVEGFGAAIAGVIIMPWARWSLWSDDGPGG